MRDFFVFLFEFRMASMESILFSNLRHESNCGSYMEGVRISWSTAGDTHSQFLICISFFVHRKHFG
jgi:hypothetical protein